VTFATPTPTRGRLLVVDDEPDILIALEDLFEADFDVIATSSPMEALNILAADPAISVIISDQRMPQMSGDAFLARAREFSDAEAIMLTGYADLKAVIGAVNASRIAGYIPKPWDPAALHAVVMNAHERRQLALDLHSERALLHGLLDHTGDAISFKDNEGRFVRLNAVKARRLGHPLEYCIGRTESELNPGPEAEASEAADRAVMLSGKPAEERLENMDASGTPHWSWTTRVPVLDGRGEIEHLGTIERDVTEQKLLEDRLRQADKMQALGTLAGGVAHDFNNLLTAILGSLDLALRRDTGDPQLGRLLNNAKMAAERGASLTQRLLSFSRRRELKARAVDINALIGEMGDLLARTLPDVQFETKLTAGAPTAMVDPDQLELAVLNLCVNARDAMNGGLIRLATDLRHIERGTQDLPAGDYAVISVSDTGTGIPPEILNRVFEPFFTTKDVGKGTGLGLSMVYGLAQQFGGGVLIDSVVGKGTTVDVLFPIAAPEKTGTAETASGRKAMPARKVLLVDDDQSVRHVTAELLNEFGHDLVECQDGRSALERLTADPSIDILVADLAMPGMNGLELAQAAHERRPGLPILLITGFAERVAIPAHISVLRKPFQREELAARLAELAG